MPHREQELSDVHLEGLPEGWMSQRCSSVMTRVRLAAWLAQRPANGHRLRCLADGGDRAQDHVRDELWLRHHDHVGTLNLGDLRAGAFGHRTSEISADGF